MLTNDLAGDTWQQFYGNCNIRLDCDRLKLMEQGGARFEVSMKAPEALLDVRINGSVGSPSNGWID